MYRLTLRVLGLVGLFLSFPDLAAAVAAAEDTWVDGGVGVRDTNFGTSETLRVRSSAQRITLIRFDSATLPAGNSGLTLNIGVKTVNVAGSVQAHLVTSRWSAATVTFNTRPKLASDVLSSVAISTADERHIVRFDISAAVRAWRSDPAHNFGVALTTDGSAAQVYFFSSEDFSRGPTLTSAVADNDVTVSPEGGDYPDPITAAANAHDGDNWCVSPQPDDPCRMRIAAGIFVLPETFIVPDAVAVIGHEKTQTLLVAGPGLDAAVSLPQRRSGIPTSLSDLSIINVQDSQAPGDVMAIDWRDENGSLHLERVALRAAGPNQNFAIRSIEFAGNRTLFTMDSELSAEGGAAATAVLMRNRAGETQLLHTQVTASRTRQAIGLDVQGPRSSEFIVIAEGLSVSATGSERAVGVEFTPASGSNAARRLNLTGMDVVAQSAGEAIGLHSAATEATELLLTNSRIRSSGGVLELAIQWPSAGRNMTLDGVSTVGTVGLSNGFGDPFTNITVLRSYLSGEVGLSVSGSTGGDSITVTVEQSFLTGTRSLIAEGPGGISLRSSVLAGPFSFADITATCAQVYGPNLTLLNGACMQAP